MMKVVSPASIDKGLEVPSLGRAVGKMMSGRVFERVLFLFVIKRRRMRPTESSEAPIESAEQ
jgi:hypothetical protein